MALGSISFLVALDAGAAPEANVPPAALVTPKTHTSTTVKAYGPPSVWGAVGIIGLATFELVRRGRAATGVTGPLAAVSYLLPVVIAAGVLAPYFSDPVTTDLEGPSIHHVETSVDLLGFSRSDPLSQDPFRPASGTGFGYELAYQYNHPSWGIVAQAGGMWQQAHLASTDWIYSTHFFGKADVGAGLDFARIVGNLADLPWLQAQRVNLRAGPGVFHAFLRQADHGTGSFVSSSDRLEVTIPITTAVGYVITAQADLDLNLEFWGVPLSLGGLRVVYEHGEFPDASAPETSVANEALAETLGFHELRGASSYTWDRFRGTVYLPGIPTVPDGGAGLGIEYTRYRSGTGASAQNLGASLTLDWKFD